MGTSLLIVVLIMAGLAFILSSIIMGMFKSSGRISDTAPMICTNCGTRGTPTSVTRGSIGIEIILWLCFLVPGLIYSIWRLSSKQEACPACGQSGMINVNTPNGRLLAERFQGTQSHKMTMADLFPSQATEPAETDAAAMAKHGIKFDGKQYVFKEYGYDKLADAIAYAKKHTVRP